MRNLKKVLALVVAFSMMLSVVAFAGYKDVPADAEYAGALDLLSSLEIIKGDDLGNFNPDATITRAEMAAIVCRALGLESAANGAKGATIFTDVAADHWASGYINLANQNNIINGYGDGKFGPEDTVTYEQVIKMLVCALGFEPMAAAKGGWATGYLVVANTYKITEGAAADATRKNVATLVYNALSTPMMDQTTFGADAEYEILNGKNGEYKTLLTDMDIYVATGTVDDYDIDTVTVTLTEDSEDLEFKKGEETFEKGDMNVAPYMYQSVDVYVQKNSRRDYEVVAIVGSVMGETLTILSDDIVETETEGVYLDKGEFEYYVDAANSNKTKKVKVSLGEKDIVLNKKVYTDGFDKLAALEDVEITLIENTSDRTFDKIVATQYTSVVVGYVDVDRDRIELDGQMVTFDFEDEDKEIILVDDQGKELTLADFAEDDVVAYVANVDSLKDLKNATKVQIIKLSNAVVTGIVDETFTSNGDEYVVINSEEYKVGKGVDTLTVGSEGTFYIGITGKIVYFDGSLVGENYAYILEAAPSKSSFSADKWQVKLLTKEDGIVTYDVTDDMDKEFDKYFADNADDFAGDKKDGILFADADDADKAAVARLITFKTNAKGQIRAFAAAKGSVNETLKGTEYTEKTQIIGDSLLEDDVVIFNVKGNEAEDAYVSDISYLADEGLYSGIVFANAKSENAAMIVYAGTGAFVEEEGIAIVTKIASTKDAEDNDVVRVSYIKDGVEGTVIFDDEVAATGSKDIDDLTIGAVFAFNANSTGVVTEYVVLAVVNEYGNLVPVAADYDEVLTSDKSYFAWADIMSEKYVGKKGGQNLTVKYNDGKEDVTKTLFISSEANMYTYDTTGKNTAIRVDSFMDSDDMDYYDADKKQVNGKVFIKVVDGEVIDIYGFAIAAEKEAE